MIKFLISLVFVSNISFAQNINVFDIHVKYLGGRVGGAVFQVNFLDDLRKVDEIENITIDFGPSSTEIPFENLKEDWAKIVNFKKDPVPLPSFFVSSMSSKDGILAKLKNINIEENKVEYELAIFSNICRFSEKSTIYRSFLIETRITKDGLKSYINGQEYSTVYINLSSFNFCKITDIGFEFDKKVRWIKFNRFKKVKDLQKINFYN